MSYDKLEQTRDVLKYIFNNIKMKELRINGQFNIVGMIIDRERRTWRYYNSENKETYFDDFDERYVVEFVDGAEDILMEYIRKLII